MGLGKRRKRTGHTASVTPQPALIGHIVENAVRKLTEQEHRRRAEEALARARAKYPNFEEWRPVMAAIAVEEYVDWGRGMDEIYAELYFRATQGSRKWEFERTKCWRPN